MLEVVTSVLILLCKRMQQLATNDVRTCITVRIQPIRLWKPFVLRVRDPNNVGRAVQTDPTLLGYPSAITEEKKHWELLAHKFDRFQTLRNNSQQRQDVCK